MGTNKNTKNYINREISIFLNEKRKTYPKQKVLLSEKAKSGQKYNHVEILRRYHR
jgi:hypothetical protein